MSDKRVEAMAKVLAEGIAPSRASVKASCLAAAAELLEFADAADDCVRVPKDVLSGMLEYIDHALEADLVTKSRMAFIGDEIEEWSKGNFGSWLQVRSIDTPNSEE